MRATVARVDLMRRAGAWLLLFALIAASVVPLMLGGSEALLAAVRFPARGQVALVALVLASSVLRALKQGLLMRQLQVRADAWRVLAISQATEFAFLATPGGIGGYAAGIYYLRRGGATYAAAAAVSAADQILDLAFFLVAMPIALLFLAEAPEVGVLREIVRASAVTAAFALAIAWLVRKPLARALFGANGLLERMPSLRRRSLALRGFLANLHGQIATLLSAPPGLRALLLATTALQWITRYGVLWLIMNLLGHPVPFALLFLLQGIVLHAAQWTGAPAGAGGADLGLAATLAPFAPTESIATALLLWRFATLHLALLAGALAALSLRSGMPLRTRSGEVEEPVARTHAGEVKGTVARTHAGAVEGTVARTHAGAVEETVARTHSGAVEEPVA